MKLHRFLTALFFLLTGTVVYAQSTVEPKQVEPAKPMEPNIVGAGGEYTTRVNIKIPEFRDLPLDVSLSYNSSNTARGGIENVVGFGWRLNAFSMIERKSLGGGVPTFNDGQDLFVLDGQELMACNDAAATNKWLGFYPLRYRTDQSSASCTAGGNFSTRVESYKRILYSPTSNSFSVTNPDGSEFIYQSLASLTGDTSPVGTELWDLANQTRWLLTEIRDKQAESNIVKYRYSFAPQTDGYAHRIREAGYAGYRVEFHYRQYGARGVMVPEFATGTIVQGRQDYQLRSIRIFDGAIKLRAYQLLHSDAGLSRLQLLNRVVEYGSDFMASGADIVQGSSLPATTYGYEAANWSLTELNPSNTPALANREFHEAVTVLDWDRNGTDDLWFQKRDLRDVRHRTDRDDVDRNFVTHTFKSSLLRMNANKEIYSAPTALSAKCGSFYTWVNMDNLYNGIGRHQDPAQILGDYRKTGSPRCLSKHYWQTYLEKGQASVDFAYVSQPMDNSSQIDVPSRTYLNNGFTVNDNVLSGSWDQDYGSWTGPFGFTAGNYDLDPETEFKFAGKLYDWSEGKFLSEGKFKEYDANPLRRFHLPFIDISGDGVGDTVSGREVGITSPEDGLFQKRSSAFFFQSPVAVPGESNLRLAGGTAESLGQADMNHDGLDDLVYYIFKENAKDELVYFPSMSKGFRDYVVVNVPELPDYGPLSRTREWVEIPRSQNARSSLKDVNGDGLVDLVLHYGFAYIDIKMNENVHSGGPYTSGTTQVFLNSGNGLVRQSDVVGSNGYIHGMIASGDFDGDGLVDFALEGGAYGETEPRLLMGTGGLPGRMVSLSNSNGGSFSINYGSSAEFGVNQMPGVQQVVKSITRNDGRGGVATTTYTYVGGAYDFINRRTLGYRTVSAQLPPIAGETVGPMVITVYQNSHIAEYGNVKSRTVTHAGITQSLDIYDYDTTTVGNGPYRSERSRERNAVLFGTSLIETTRSFTTTLYGAPFTETSFGFTNGGVDIDPSDNTTVAYEYVPNLTKYIVNRPVFRRLHAGAVATYDRTTWQSAEYFKYDGNTKFWEAPTSGNTTLSAQWNGVSAGTTIAFGRVQTATYDARGNLISEINPRGQTITHGYDTVKGLFRVSTRNALGQTVTSSWNTACQVPLEVSDPNGLKTTYQYDVFCRVTRQTQPNGQYQRTSYNSLGSPTAQFIETESKSGSTTSGSTLSLSRAYLDGFGRPYKTTSPGAVTDITASTATLTAYDARGNVAWQSIPLAYASTTASAAQRITMSYDPLNRPLQTIHPDGAIKKIGYFATTTSHNGGPSLAYPYVFTQNEDCNDISSATVCGDYAEIFDAQSRRIYQGWYDRAFTDTDAAGHVWRGTRYVYSPDGDLLQITDPKGAVWTYVYDVYGNRTRATDPGLGTWNMAYDANGNLTSQTDAKGQVITFSYDALDRPTQKRVTGGQDGTQTTSMIYDEVEANFFNIGKLTRQTRGEHSIEYDYATTGTVHRERHTIGTRVFHVQNSFAPSGAVINQYLPYQPGGQASRWIGTTELDAAGRVTRIANALGGTFIGSVTYNSRNQPTRIDYGNAAVDVNTYSAARGWVDRMESYEAGAPIVRIANNSYTRAPSGKVSRVDSIYPQGDLDYTYDYMGRLRTATNFSGQTDYTQNFTYDRAGRMVFNSRVGTYSYTASNPFHAPTSIARAGGGTSSFTYDANGNMTLGLDGKVMTYDGENRPLSVAYAGTTTTYTYAADGSRLKKTVTTGGTSKVTAYFGGVEIRNFGQGAAEEILTYPHPNISLKNGVMSVLHKDQLGSVTAVTGPNGLKDERTVYRPFGEPVEFDHDPIATNETKRFLGERYDADAGLSYLNARYYDPELSLFLQPDWFEVTKAGVGTNRFSYSFNDPVNLSDPNGNASVYHKDGSITHVKPGTPEHDALDRYNSGDRSQFRTGSDLRSYLQNGGSSGSSYRNERGDYYAGYSRPPAGVGFSGGYSITVSTQGTVEGTIGIPKQRLKLRGIPGIVALLLGLQDQQEPEYAYHFTTVSGMERIVASQHINPSLVANAPHRARLGDGVYLTTIDPLGNMTRGQIARALFGDPRVVNRVAAWVTVRIDGLDFVRHGTTVLVTTIVPLYIGNRIAGYGKYP